jgi:hypothetical protein
LAGLTAEEAAFFADDFAAGAGDLAACFFRAAIADTHAVLLETMCCLKQSRSLSVWLAK